MRRLTFELNIVGYGYVVGGGDCGPHRDWTDDSTLPAIQMKILKCTDNICDYVDQNIFFGKKSAGWKNFRKNYQDILHGVDYGWRLIRFSVSGDGVILEYYSQRFNETTMISLGILRDLKYSLEFNVPRSNGKPNAIYRVDARNSSNGVKNVLVTEYGSETRREFDFTRGPNDGLGSNSTVFVTEYADI